MFPLLGIFTSQRRILVLKFSNWNIIFMIISKITLKKTYQMISLLKNWGGRTRTSEMAVPKTAALPLGDTPLLGTFLLYILKINCQ